VDPALTAVTPTASTTITMQATTFDGSWVNQTGCDLYVSTGE
jgi:hypothetical protein